MPSHLYHEATCLRTLAITASNAKQEFLLSKADLDPLPSVERSRCAAGRQQRRRTVGRGCRGGCGAPADLARLAGRRCVLRPGQLAGYPAHCAACSCTLQPSLYAPCCCRCLPAGGRRACPTCIS